MFRRWSCSKSAAFGRKIAIRPQRRTDGIEVPNLWGCIVGRPGMMKSPAMSEALKPLHRLDAVAREEHANALKAHAGKVELHKLALDEAKAAARKALRAGGEAQPIDIEEPDEPKARRYVVNDTTYEALGEILADNPNGVLAFRDELVSLLKTLDREEYCAARGFFLTAWNGTTGYTFDRILRGKTHIEAACLSLLGSTQPGRLAECIRRAVAGGAGDDGLIQRFGLLVWPDQSGEWKECDRWPDGEARAKAWQAFERLDKLDPDAVGAAGPIRVLAAPSVREKRAGAFFRVAGRPRKAPSRGGHGTGPRKPSRQVSETRSCAGADQPSCRRGARTDRREAAAAGARVRGFPRNTSPTRLRGGCRQRGGNGQSHPSAYPQGRTSRWLRSARHKAQGMVRPD